MNKKAGFTFLELLIALAIVSIVAVFSFSGFKNLYSTQNNKILQTQLLDAIQLAQQEAKIKRKLIGLCKSNQGDRCLGEWQQGFIVFIDEQENGEITDKSQILMATQSKFQQGVLYSRSYPSYRDYLQFSPNGFLATDNGTFWYCATGNTNPAWAVSVSKTGLTQVMYPDKQGIIKDSSGKALIC